MSHDPAVPGFTLAHDARIPNTFRVPVRSRILARLHEAQALPDLLKRIDGASGGRLFVLGAGSNVLFTRDFDGTVLQLATRGIRIVSNGGAGARVRVAAGENWDAFVRWSLAAGFAGLENLILIPGTAGAAPIQNIGAYGVELSEFTAAVEVWDRHASRFTELAAAECAFGYRDSLFKHVPDRYLVIALVLDLPRERALHLDYRGVRQELEAMGIDTPDHADVGRAVERLRLRRLPDPRRIGNAGSFFKNPLVPAAVAEDLRAHHAALPVYPGENEAQVKLSAAWLIEACGFKGMRDGDVGVSEQHALVLVNFGAAGGGQIWALAERIRHAVAERFGILLQPEPIIL